MGALKISKYKWSVCLWLVLFVLIFVVCHFITGGRVLSVSNINSIIIHAISTMMISWAFCFVFALDYMDLSIFSVVVLASIFASALGNQIGVIGILIAALAVGAALMFVNFVVHAKSGIPSWIGGLGMCLIYEAIAAGYSTAMIKAGSRVGTLDTLYRQLATAPYAYIIIAAGFILAYLIYNRTNIGLNARSIGNEPAVAKEMGINFSKTVILAGIVCGILVGLGAVLNISLSGQVSAQTGLTSLGSMFQPLASVMFAQIISQLDKRINIIVAVPFCAVLIYTIFNVLTLMGIPSGTLQNVFLGGIVLVLGIVANIRTRGIVK